MLNTTKRGIAIIAAIAMILIVAGCGSGSDEETAADTPEQIKADKAIAQQAVLKAADLPSSYESTPHSDADNDAPEAVTKKFATCMELSPSEAEEFVNGSDDPSAPSVDSADFRLTDKLASYSTTFQSSVTIERSSKDISDPLAILAREDRLQCWKDVFQAALSADLEPGQTVTGVKVVAVDTGDIGDAGAALGVRANFNVQARTVPAYINLYFVGSGRAGITFVATGTGKAVDKDLALSLLKKVADRLEDKT